MKPGVGLNVKKEVLANHLPLDTPYLLFVFPIYACNFECGYCLNSVVKKRYKYKRNVLDLQLFKRRIDECGEFANKLKMIRFAGLGEPLLHKNITKMVDYAVQSKVAETVEIITNGSLLTKDLSDALISASLDKIKISVQALSAKKYKEIANADIDFDAYINNIRYFYNNRTNTKIHIKIFEYALSKEDSEEKFYDLFGDICDEISIENVYAAVDEIDYSPFIGNNEGKTTLGFDCKDLKVCPQPFYTITLEPDGSIGCCCSYNSKGIPIILQNTEQTIKQIWEGKDFNSFQLKMLDGAHLAHEICRGCNGYRFGGIHPNDYLDEVSENLKNLYFQRVNN